MERRDLKEYSTGCYWRYYNWPLGALAELRLLTCKRKIFHPHCSSKRWFSRYFLWPGRLGRNGEYDQSKVAEQMGLLGRLPSQ